MSLKALGFSGYKNSGKTSIIIETARILKNSNYRVGIIKNLHGYSIDKEDSDTWKHRKVADFVGSIGEEGAVLFNKPDSLEELIKIMPKVDILLIEGFKNEKTFPKIILPRSSSEIQELSDGLELGVYVEDSDYDLEEEGTKKISNPEEIADLVEDKGFKLPNVNCGDCGFNCYELAKEIENGNKSVYECVQLEKEVKIYINNKELDLKGWVQGIVKNTIIGMLSSLKGFENGKIEIEIENSEE